jgi:hypothetical protein
MAPDDTIDDSSPGWDAISAAVAPLYPDQEPKHVGTLIKWMLGGPDPLDGISAWKRLLPVPHWHFVSYGLTELYGKDCEDPAVSGFGFELTFRLACDPAEENPPIWAFSLMQNLARYVFESGNTLNHGEWMNANGPIAQGTETLLHSLAFVSDPELPAIDTPHGRVAFIQIVGLTLDEEAAAKRWEPPKLLDAVLPYMPLWTTDLSRGSLMDRAEVREQAEAGIARDGSSTGMLFMPALAWSAQRRLLRPAIITVRLGAAHVAELLLLLSLRLPFGRELRLAGSQAAITFAPGETDALSEQDGALRILLSPASLEAMQATLLPKAGTYRVPNLGGIEWEVEQTHIRDAAGRKVRTVG